MKVILRLVVIVLFLFTLISGGILTQKDFDETEKAIKGELEKIFTEKDKIEDIISFSTLYGIFRTTNTIKEQNTLFQCFKTSTSKLSKEKENLTNLLKEDFSSFNRNAEGNVLKNLVGDLSKMKDEKSQKDFSNKIIKTYASFNNSFSAAEKLSDNFQKCLKNKKRLLFQKRVASLKRNKLWPFERLTNLGVAIFASAGCGLTTVGLILHPEASFLYAGTVGCTVATCIWAIQSIRAVCYPAEVVDVPRTVPLLSRIDIEMNDIPRRNTIS
jgi:hypothetical protein